MKTTIKIVSAFVLTCCFFSAAAQYDSAAGIRLTDNAFLGTYKLNMNDRLSVEGMAGFPTNKGADGLIIGAEFQLNTEIPDLANLRWFYGAGANLYIGDDSATFLYGAGGIDYYFDELPLNLTLEVLPGLILGENDLKVYFALSARYILGQ